MDAALEMQNAKCKMQNAKCKMQNAKCKMVFGIFCRHYLKVVASVTDYNYILYYNSVLQ